MLSKLAIAAAALAVSVPALADSQRGPGPFLHREPAHRVDDRVVRRDFTRRHFHHYYPPQRRVVIMPPPRVYYAPAPVYYGPPAPYGGVSIRFDIPF